MIKYICKYPKCENTTTEKNGYCNLHKHIHHIKPERKKNKYAPSSTLYNSHSWRTLRKKILQRDGFACQICGNTENLVIDHIQPHQDNLELFYDTDNLITLCKSCHDYKTLQEIKARRKQKQQLKKDIQKGKFNDKTI